MPTLYIVGGGLFGSQAAAWARRHGIESVVFDAGCAEAASPPAAGLFQESWLGGKLRAHAQRGLPVLEQLYGIRTVYLTGDDGRTEPFLFVPPTAILEPEPVRQRVTAVGDGWLEADGRRYEGWVYLAAGIWCEQLLPGLSVHGRAGAAFRFAGERPGQVRFLSWGRQAIAFVRDPGTTHFTDGTAERSYTTEHDHQTLQHASDLGLTEPPLQRLLGWRPYAAGGLVFQKRGNRTWVATGGRKMGTLLGAACAHRLVEALCS